MPANFALALNDFFVCQHRAQGLAPIDRHFRNVCQSDIVSIFARVGLDGFGLVRNRIEPGIVKPKKNPLRPPKVVRVGGAKLPCPVVTEADGLELRPEAHNIALRRSARVLASFDRELFRRQPEGIPTHGVQDVEAAHPLETGNDIGSRISFDVAHVQTLATRVREHVEDVEFRFCGIKSRFPRVRRTKNPVGQPSGLPFGFEIEKGKLLALGCHIGPYRT